MICQSGSCRESNKERKKGRKRKKNAGLLTHLSAAPATRALSITVDALSKPLVSRRSDDAGESSTRESGNQQGAVEFCWSSLSSVDAAEDDVDPSTTSIGRRCSLLRDL